MSLYNSNQLTSVSYANVDNSNPKPLTATGNDSDAVFRGPNAAPVPSNPMKGGYTYRRKQRRRNARISRKNSTKSPTISSVLGMDINTRSKSGGNKHRTRHMRYRHHSVGMALGRKGGRTRRGKHHRRRHLKGGVAPFPTGYSLGGPLNHNLSALANPPVYQPYSN